VELHFIRPEKLEERILNGDDHAQWIFRYGKLLHGEASLWERYSALLERGPWPDWTRKLDPARRHLQRAFDLLRMGDLGAACDQGLRAADLLARAILLQRKVWPLSRPELPDQLRSIGEPHMVSALETLGEPTPGAPGIEEALSRVASAIGAHGDPL
jgi:hypothetical protein